MSQKLIGIGTNKTFQFQLLKLFDEKDGSFIIQLPSQDSRIAFNDKGVQSEIHTNFGSFQTKKTCLL
jgi:hypothetical protein